MCGAAAGARAQRAGVRAAWRFCGVGVGDRPMCSHERRAGRAREPRTDDCRASARAARAGKKVGQEKKFSKELENKMLEEYSSSPKMHGSSPLGPLSRSSTRKLLINLITTMNSAFQDYDFRSWNGARANAPGLPLPWWRLVRFFKLVTLTNGWAMRCAATSARSSSSTLTSLTSKPPSTTCWRTRRKRRDAGELRARARSYGKLARGCRCLRASSLSSGRPSTTSSTCRNVRTSFACASFWQMS
jgi:hypothetical protein